MRDQLRRPSLHKHARRWERAASSGAATLQLATGPLVVLDADLAHEVVTSRSEYRAISPFFRTRSRSSLPRHVHGTLNRSLLAAIAAHELPIPRLRPSSEGGAGRLRRFAWGVGHVRRYFAPVIASGRPPDLEHAVDSLIREKIIADDLSGRLRRMPADDRDGLGEVIGTLVRRSRANAQPIDLVDVVSPLADELPTTELGELFFRLVASLVSFTGAALEMATLVAAEHADFRSAARDRRPLRPYLLETQRLYPTAWRLVRQSALDHEVGGTSVPDGGMVMVATSVLHRHRRHWEQPEEFDPSRWQEASAEHNRAYLPFGRGHVACPGKDIALEVLEGLLGGLYREHAITVSGSARRHPYVRGALGPPRRTVTAHPLREAAA